MKNIMFKIISILVGVVALVYVIDLSLDKFTLASNLAWLPVTLAIILKIALSVLTLSAVLSAILNVMENTKNEGRTYIDKFILRTACVFLLLFWVVHPAKDYRLRQFYYSSYGI